MLVEMDSTKLLSYHCSPLRGEIQSRGEVRGQHSGETSQGEAVLSWSRGHTEGFGNGHCWNSNSLSIWTQGDTSFTARHSRGENSLRPEQEKVSPASETDRQTDRTNPVSAGPSGMPASTCTTPGARWKPSQESREGSQLWKDLVALEVPHGAK